jgi:excisionase family DNA binding protein
MLNQDDIKTDIKEMFISQEEVRNMFFPAISRMTIYRWCKEGRLQCYRIKGRTFFKYEEVTQALCRRIPISKGGFNAK